MMKVAIVGSRGITTEHLQDYLPNGITEIISGGAKGIDTCAANYANSHGIKITEFLPQYNIYGKAAPLKRNLQIIEAADLIIAFWDGKSRGTKYVIEQSKKNGTPITVIILKGND